MNLPKTNVIPQKAGILKYIKQVPAFAGIIPIILFISLAPSLLSAQGYKIETMVHNSTDTVAYLGHHFATQRYLDDTVKVVNGRAIFEGDKTLIDGIYFYYTPANYFEFLIEDQHFTLETTAPNFTKSMKVTNSKINDGFYRLQQFTGEMKLKNKLLREEYDSAKTDAEKERIKTALQHLNTEVEDFQTELKKENAGTFFAKLLTLMQSPKVPEISEEVENPQLYRYEYYKSHFWKGIDIADPGLLRTPLLDAKIKDYLDNVIIQHSDSVIKEVDLLIAQTEKSKEAYRFLLITLVNKYESTKVMDFDKVFVHIIEKYYLTGKADEWTDKETLDKLRNRVAMIKPNFLGNNAPQLVMWDTLGNEINLRDIDAEYTVLYFYAPDCGHCKKKTPVLYEAYPDLVAKGVEILGICTTTDEKEWKDFIKTNDLGWINLADLESRTYVKYYYDVRSTPTVYILDKDKKILLKKIDALDIPNVIDQLIKQKEL
jgi:peroxiredoxin